MSAAASPSYRLEYQKNPITGRPNQVFVCTVCGQERPKLVKMTKHLNTHTKARLRRQKASATGTDAVIQETSQHEASQVTIRLP